MKLKPNIKALFRGLPLLTFSFFAQNQIFAEELNSINITSSDSVLSTTLSELYDKGESAVESGYTLSIAGDDSDLTITKYYYDEDTKAFVGVNLDVAYDTTGESNDRQNIEADTLVESITGDFIKKAGNTGSAIYNLGTINSITSNFFENYYSRKNGFTDAGAIYNGYIINSITGDFIANYVNCIKDNTIARGGAIYNQTTGIIGSITGDFIANFAKGGTTVSGGAILNNGTISSITGDFIENYVTSIGAGEITGGAIHNIVNIGSVDAESGVITGGIIGNIYGNSVYSESATVTRGGAIYNTVAGSIVFNTIAGNDYLYLNNWAGSTEETKSDANGGFLYNAGGTVYFNTESGSSITIGDGTTGFDSIAGSGSINKTGSGSLYINSSMAYYTGSVNIKSGSMYLSNVMNESSIINIDENGNLTIVLNSINFGEDILGTLTGSGDLYVGFDYDSLGSLLLTDSITSIYGDASGFSGDIAWDSSVSTNNDGDATITIGSTNYIVSINDAGEIIFKVDAGSGDGDGDTDDSTSATYTLVKVEGDVIPSGLTIVKYEDVDGTLSAVKYNVSINSDKLG
ncbi:MAG: hypothetical protein R3Y46_07190 [Opitutales bacterium]